MLENINYNPSFAVLRWDWIGVKEKKETNSEGRRGSGRKKYEMEGFLKTNESDSDEQLFCIWSISVTEYWVSGMTIIIENMRQKC